MTKTITATEAVRKFSERLNSIKNTGNVYTIMRGGKPVATIRSAETHAKALTLGDLAGLVKSLPHSATKRNDSKRTLKKPANIGPLCQRKTNGHGLLRGVDVFSAIKILADE